MAVVDVAKYRCINEACGRGHPRQVNFCPYCGTRQHAAALPSGADTVTASPADVYEKPAMSSSQIAAALEGLNKTRAIKVPPVDTNGAASAPQPTQTAAPAAAAAAAAAPASRPPLREPIGAGTWILVALVLAAIWYLSKPSDANKKHETRVEQALALTTECKLEQARAELASLRADKASAAQMRRLQDGIVAASAGCERKRQRTKAWTVLRPVLESALQTGDIERADSRLSAFTKKWGADDDTRDWDKRIDLKKGDRLLDEADACLKKSDRYCLENKLQAAERLQRDEFADRIHSLREALSRLLEATMLEQRPPSP
jgi:hypothetical protein